MLLVLVLLVPSLLGLVVVAARVVVDVWRHLVG